MCLFCFVLLFRQDGIIELREEEASYFTDHSYSFSKQLRKEKEMRSLERKEREKKSAADVSFSWWQNRLDNVYANIRSRLLNIPSTISTSLKNPGGYGCYSIRTNSANTISSTGDDDYDSENPPNSKQDQQKSADDSKAKEVTSEISAANECHPSITKMSFHSNVPSSVLTFTICAFQFTQSSGLLLSFAYLLML